VTQKDLQQVSGIKIRNIPYIALILLTESRCGLLVPSFDKRRCRDLKRIRGMTKANRQPEGRKMRALHARTRPALSQIRRHT
jgi:hypothetical protein